MCANASCLGIDMMMYAEATKRIEIELGTDKLKITCLPVKSNSLSVCELVHLGL
jgi:hypothetical protein